MPDVLEDRCMLSGSPPFTTVIFILPPASMPPVLVGSSEFNSPAPGGAGEVFVKESPTIRILSFESELGRGFDAGLLTLKDNLLNNPPAAQNPPPTVNPTPSPVANQGNNPVSDGQTSDATGGVSADLSAVRSVLSGANATAGRVAASTPATVVAQAATAAAQPVTAEVHRTADSTGADASAVANSLTPALVNATNPALRTGSTVAVPSLTTVPAGPSTAVPFGQPQELVRHEAPVTIALFAPAAPEVVVPVQDHPVAIPEGAVPAVEVNPAPIAAGPEAFFTETLGLPSFVESFVPLGENLIPDLPVTLPDVAAVEQLFEQLTDWAGALAPRGWYAWLSAAALAAVACEVGRRQLKSSAAEGEDTATETPPEGWVPEDDARHA
jgi:hypothetical protein